MHFISVRCKDGTSGQPIGEVEMADYDSRDGSFTVPGREGYGIPPGKYRIALVETLRREALDQLKKASKPKRGQQRITNDTNFLEAVVRRNDIALRSRLENLDQAHAGHGQADWMSGPLALVEACLLGLTPQQDVIRTHRDSQQESHRVSSRDHLEDDKFLDWSSGLFRLNGASKYCVQSALEPKALVSPGTAMAPRAASSMEIRTANAHDRDRIHGTLARQWNPVDASQGPTGPKYLDACAAQGHGN